MADRVVTAKHGTPCRRARAASAVRADDRRHRAVERDPVGADDDRVDRLRGQQPARGGIGDHRGLGAGQGESSGRGARFVLHRSGLEDPGMDRSAPRDERPGDRRRAAAVGVGRVAARSQRQQSERRSGRGRHGVRAHVALASHGRAHPGGDVVRGEEHLVLELGFVGRERHRGVPGRDHPADRPVDRGDVAASPAEDRPARPDPRSLGLRGRAANADHGEPQSERGQLRQERRAEDRSDRASRRRGRPGSRSGSRRPIAGRLAGRRSTALRRRPCSAKRPWRGPSLPTRSTSASASRARRAHPARPAAGPRA